MYIRHEIAFCPWAAWVCVTLHSLITATNVHCAREILHGYKTATPFRVGERMQPAY